MFTYSIRLLAEVPRCNLTTNFTCRSFWMTMVFSIFSVSCVRLPLAGTSRLNVGEKHLNKFCQWVGLPIEYFCEINVNFYVR